MPGERDEERDQADVAVGKVEVEELTIDKLTVAGNEVPPTPADEAAGRDPQLEKAIELALKAE